MTQKKKQAGYTDPAGRYVRSRWRNHPVIPSRDDHMPPGLADEQSNNPAGQQACEGVGDYSGFLAPVLLLQTVSPSHHTDYYLRHVPQALRGPGTGWRRRSKQKKSMTKRGPAAPPCLAASDQRWARGQSRVCVHTPVVPRTGAQWLSSKGLDPSQTAQLASFFPAGGCCIAMKIMDESEERLGRGIYSCGCSSAV